VIVLIFDPTVNAEVNCTFAAAKVVLNRSVSVKSPAAVSKSSSDLMNCEDRPY